jgi:S-adenosylmethionine:tRNA ribosyltransferase-isomerase
MQVSEFHYDLLEELIAQHPPAERGGSRMLTLDRRTGAFADHRFSELPKLLRSGDLLVLNNSRVLPARLYARRAGLHTQHRSPEPSGLIEVLLTERMASEGGNDWTVLARPAKKVQPGETLLFAESDDGEPLLRAMVLAAGEFGERTIRFEPAPDFIHILERIGHMPLPPYIHRERQRPDTAEDRERYQTVYSRQTGSAAAPTAGLHFTEEILDALAERGVELASITLHVGLGTFQPVRVADTREIRLHAEHYTLSATAAEAISTAHREGRRIIAVGTTTTRTLEHLARHFEAAHGEISESNPLVLEPQSSSTSLFLSPAPDGEAEFKVVRGLLTNFHLPESTLLMLVSAFAGREKVLRAYAHAVAARYRFFSYGDCMLIL